MSVILSQHVHSSRRRCSRRQSAENERCRQGTGNQVHASRDKDECANSLEQECEQDTTSQVAQVFEQQVTANIETDESQCYLADERQIFGQFQGDQVEKRGTEKCPNDDEPHHLRNADSLKQFAAEEDHCNEQPNGCQDVLLNEIVERLEHGFSFAIE